MTIYVYRAGQMVAKDTGQPMIPPDQPWVPALPQVRGDYEAYRSPITGEMIEGKRARNEDLKRHNCVDGRDYQMKTSEFVNPHFMAKRGINPDGSPRKRTA